MNLTDVSGNDAGDIWFSYTQRTVGLSAGVQRTLLQKSRYRIFLGAELMPSYVLGLWSTSHIESPDPAFDNMDNTNKEYSEAFRKFNVAGLLNPGIELNINILVLWEIVVYVSSRFILLPGLLQ